MPEQFTVTKYNDRLFAIWQTASKLVEESEPRVHAVDDLDFEDARERCRLLSRLIRTVGDQLSELEAGIKAHAPPHCDLRVRKAGSYYRPGMMKIDGNDWWLALACSGQFVLELRVEADDGEASFEAAARFERACSMSADEKLAEMLAAQPRE
jgi:hypothetical protein